LSFSLSIGRRSLRDFQNTEGKGDRGFMVLSNGTGDLAGFSGSEIPLIARVNPRTTGKPVFHFDNTERGKINDE